MSEETENLVLELLRRMRDQLDRMEADLGDVKVRMTLMEQRMSGLETSQAVTNRRLDRLDERVGRIERRLDLTEAVH